MSLFAWNTQNDNYEMRDVVHLESLIEQMDGRNSLNTVHSNNSSESSISVNKEQKHDYDYEENNSFNGNEEEQSLVPNDLETTTEQQTTTAKHIDFSDLYNSSFSPQRLYIDWVQHESKDGLYTFRNPGNGDIMVQSIESDRPQLIVEGSRMKIDNNTLQIDSYDISGDGKYILMKTNVTKQWRYSSHSNAYIYDIKKMTLSPLNQQSTFNSTPSISHILWSPSGHRLAYVMNNDLYSTDLVNHTRITFDGSNTILNGVHDWVYEEEVFGNDLAIWWSPDSTHLAYLRFDETSVPDYHLQYYTQNTSYPEEMTIKYPKPGAPNPLVSLHLYSLTSHTSMMLTSNATVNATAKVSSNFKEFNISDRILTDVIWATNTSSHLLFKQTNRVQDNEITNLVTIQANETRIESTRNYIPSDEGWIDISQSMNYLSTATTTTTKTNTSQSIVSYIDVLDNGKGYMHLALVKTGGKKSKRINWLTSGKWEVIPGSITIDHQRNFLYYTSTERSHLERHLYRMQLNDKSTKICLTCPEDPEEHAYYSHTFSSHQGYYVLNLEGPGLPKTVIKKTSDEKFEKILTDNASLKELLKEFDLPRTRMTSVKSGGVDMDAMEILPPDFDATKKYPVLFCVYGGPGSQMVNYRFDLNWSTFLASKLGYIVVTVDGRGTGFKGRKYRVGVRGRLGELETIDQINAA
ncbi:hypothetical protein CU098_002315, partial [Rhizopus stolonifer]